MSLEEQIVQEILHHNFSFLSDKKELLTSSKFSLPCHESIIKEVVCFPLPRAHLSIMHVVAYENDLESLIYLNEVGQIDLNIQSANEYIPLQYGIVNNSIEVVSYILSKDINLTEMVQTKRKQFNLLYLAIFSDNIEILKILLKHGFYLKNEIFYRDNIFMPAIINNNCDIITTILRELVKSNLHSIKSEILCMDFLEKFINDIIRLNRISLLKTVVKYVEVSISNIAFYLINFQSIILMNSKSKALKILNLLIQSTKVDDLYNYSKIKKTMQPFEGSLIHWICKSGEPNVAKIFFAQGKIDMYDLDEHGNSGPHYLLGLPTNKIIKILDVLFQNGFDINFQPVKKTFDKTYTKKNCLLADFVLYYDDYIAVIKYLLEHGANPNILIAQGNTIYNHVKNQIEFSYISKKHQLKYHLKILSLFDQYH